MQNLFRITTMNHQFWIRRTLEPWGKQANHLRNNQGSGNIGWFEHGNFTQTNKL